MSGSKIRFTRASNGDIENLKSFILEADADEGNIAAVFCADFRWRVRMGTADGTIVDLVWEDFLKIAHEFSVFVAEESEYMLSHKKTIQDDPDLE